MVGKQQLIHSATNRMCQLNWTADAAELKSPFLSLTNGLAVVHPHYGYWLLLYYMLIRRRRRNGIRRQHLQNSAVQPLKSMRCIQIAVLVFRRTAPRSQRTIIIAYYTDLALQITFINLPSIFLAHLWYTNQYLYFLLVARIICPQESSSLSLPFWINLQSRSR